MNRMILLILLFFTVATQGGIVANQDFVVEMDKQYSWLVKRGDLHFWIKNENLVLSLDPKGEESCLLTVQDALDVYSILHQFGQKLFNNSDTSAKYRARVAQEQKNSFFWEIDDERLRVFLNDKSEYLQISYTGKGPIILDIGLISEMAQIIRVIVENATEKQS